jgi:hypothetical protein
MNATCSSCGSQLIIDELRPTTCKVCGANPTEDILHEGGGDLWAQLADLKSRHARLVAFLTSSKENLKTMIDELDGEPGEQTARGMHFAYALALLMTKEVLDA